MARIGPLADLHLRHPGVTSAISRAYAEAVAVSLARHYRPPSELATWINESINRVQLDWALPDDRTRQAWANDIDTTEAAAYGVALGIVEMELGLVAVARARSLSGADYYIAQHDVIDGLESAYKLEVSGVDHGGTREIRSRLREKLRQVTAYGAPARAYACVVGFKALTVLVRET